ncbi:MAG TPA: hypothetical protein DEP69_00450, partial [Acidimicrobiaceae bacterium]|nr:hypothetical protein [Acidimicrobiaceae bacterium]
MPAAAPAKPPNPAGAEIERWLRENPDGPLVVAGGYVSVRGLCWLAQRTRDRPVTLVVGDTR